ncbi:uncharacterized protein TA20295 [Theileria annulata]|uniref:Uncharacterized protein n=1 Tax=Theileria annulata TaxID=5874 RepID=Q4UH98_THEAN|nr:uncharacterized protein TA20295 [Theileria annulata]CAI73541.1 hypothetical protein TA20295 [Theileria annulata]|eukprot:XP_954218.1 hypothetical protein TA20295 [Theileria annulata]
MECSQGKGANSTAMECNRERELILWLPSVLWERELILQPPSGKGANFTATECTMGKGANSMVTKCTMGKGANFTATECNRERELNDTFSTPGKGANFTAMECNRERELILWLPSVLWVNSVSSFGFNSFSTVTVKFAISEFFVPSFNNFTNSSRFGFNERAEPVILDFLDDPLDPPITF